MNVRDPVCGMEFEDWKAAAIYVYEEDTYQFCSIGCREAFETDPERYREEPGNRSEEAAEECWPAPGWVRICPVCGTSTAIERDLQLSLGGLSLGELEALVRGEWRRRLGPDGYSRPHRRSLIRALLVYALVPESPVRASILRDRLWDEVSALEVTGLSRRGVEKELRQLIGALEVVLEGTALPSEERREVIRRIDRALRGELGWPALEWEEVSADRT